MKPETLELMAIAIDPEAFDVGLPNWRYWSSRRKSAIKKAENAYAALTTTDEYQTLMADAERYRWLRDDAMHGARHDPAIAVVGDMEDACLFGVDADAAIDAARNE